jgi:ectoine hydroxylase-related dioxygenase (phytanoyl-CoA dioxygenase family)
MKTAEQISQALSIEQIEFFHTNGYLVVERAIDGELLAKLKQRFSQWVEDSRPHTAPYGETIDGKPRFDLEPGHSAEKPGLRRVNAPVEISGDYYEAMSTGRIPAMVADLIGPDVKFHHSKINSKLPGGQTEVKWHQDFPFTPHSNDDLITALIMIDDVTAQNGPLKVVPGSHNGKIHGLWHNEVFTGAVEQTIAEDCERDAISCSGPAGSVCLMHTRLLHGSATNRSRLPRTLFICVYSADDAIPCSPSPMPNRYEGLLVAGSRCGRIRCVPFQVRAPELPKTASFFDQQSAAQ